jgi:chromosome segregation ATPase
MDVIPASVLRSKLRFQHWFFTNMAKPTSVSYDAVAAICRGLFAEGKNPTFPQVYTALGNVGSAKIVQGFINDWRKEMAVAVGAGRTPEIPGVPTDAVSAWMGFLPKLWPALFDAAEALFKEQRNAQEAAMEAERGAMAECEQSLRDAANGANALLQSAEADVTLLRSKNQKLSEKAEDLATRLAVESEACRRAEADLGEIRRDFADKESLFNGRVAELESRLDIMRREHADALLAERRERTDELDRLHRAHQGELADREGTMSSLRDQVAEKIEMLAGVRAELAQLAGKATQQEQENQRLYATVTNLHGQLRVSGQQRAAADARSAALEEFRLAETKRADDLKRELDVANRHIERLQGPTKDESSQAN